MVSVAAAPDHTVVLLQAYCPPLPHDASVTNARGQPGLESCRARALGPEAASEQEGDVDSDFGDGAEDEKESPRDDHPETGVGAACFNDANEVLAPLSLKQHCEIVLAREVDLRNAASLLAYADALDAPALVEYCARFVSANLDGILVLGRESDRCCLLETSGALVRSAAVSPLGGGRRHECEAGLLLASVWPTSAQSVARFRQCCVKPFCPPPPVFLR